MKRRNILGFLGLVFLRPVWAVSQSERWEFIEKMIRRGIFAKVSVSNGVSKAFTGPNFSGLSFESKNNFCSVVYAYYNAEDRRNDLLRVVDGNTNKTLGTFSPASGGLQLN